MSGKKDRFEHLSLPSSPSGSEYESGGDTPESFHRRSGGGNGSDSTKKPRYNREVESLISFNAVLDQFPNSDSEGSKERRRTRRGQGDSSFDDLTPPEFLKGRISRKLLTRPKGVGGERLVVFVEPTEEVNDFWPVAMVVPTLEWNESVGKIRPGECVVRYFEDLRYAVVAVRALAIFSEDLEPFPTFNREFKNFAANKGIRRALDYQRKQILPQGFKWPLWGAAEEEAEKRKSSPKVSTPRTMVAKDNEPVEKLTEKTFGAEFNRILKENGIALNKPVTIGNKDVNFYKLYIAVIEKGGYEEVSKSSRWKDICASLGFGVNNSGNVKSIYEKYLLSLEEENFDPTMQVDYQVGDIVMVLSQGYKHQVKILKVRDEESEDGDEEGDYYIHFVGWKSK